MTRGKKVVISEGKLVPKDRLSGHELLFRQYFKPLTVYAMKLTGDRQDAEDIVQDVFVQLWNKDTSSINANMTPYLFVAVKNGYLKKVRHLKVKRKYDERMNHANHVNANPHHYLMLKEVEKCVEETLNSVPERTRDIFMLSRFEQKKHKEIAEALQVSIKTVEAHLTKVLSLLRGKLSHHLGSLLILIGNI